MMFLLKSFTFTFFLSCTARPNTQSIGRFQAYVNELKKNSGTPSHHRRRLAASKDDHVESAHQAAEKLQKEQEEYWSDMNNKLKDQHNKASEKLKQQTENMTKLIENMKPEDEDEKFWKPRDVKFPWPSTYFDNVATSKIVAMVGAAFLTLALLLFCCLRVCCDCCAKRKESPVQDDEPLVKKGKGKGANRASQNPPVTETAAFRGGGKGNARASTEYQDAENGGNNIRRTSQSSKNSKKKSKR